ncbi:hypothetical protein PVAND_009058 [Polypedilum vanderplanki]|uniref:Chitin-binding type-2 domain-containing protein n=1 Tax=Polypedilum vanderplanki TaxID=319348 RepID=A0A9J6CCX7_POLVA|nr:hypothetical protein PVAND_009058 [Polypedilum vanderplanki]
MKASTLILLAIIGLLFSVTVSANTDLNALCEDELIRFGIHPDDCTQHFLCALSRPILFQCPPGKVYVQEMRACIYGNVETCEAEV